MLLRISGYVDRVRKHLKDHPFLLVSNAGAEERARLPEEGNIIKPKDATHGQKRGFVNVSIISLIQPSKVSRLQHPLISISGDDYEDTTAEMQVTPILPPYSAVPANTSTALHLQLPPTRRSRDSVVDARDKMHPSSVSPRAKENWEAT